ncbi:hypothetical protein [Nocardioides lijunqiniae]|uniref:hypothetical protein n=1 Tax=Nocardioides lijunqiniae TaxID=2760832 RepID=UPI001877F9FC|nr:hypothetical protein [Nocardioides lijunqiniae]
MSDVSDRERPQRGSILSDLAPTLASLSLFVIACVTGFLLFYPAHVDFDPEADVSSGTVCTSVVSAGWPRANSSGISDGLDDVGRAPYDEAASACHTRRTTYVAGIAVLSVPASLLGCWLMVTAPRRRGSGIRVAARDSETG